jgi:hypothetical protein
MAEEVGGFLGEFGLGMQEIEGDGNCFCRAVAVASGKTQADHAGYRESAVAQLLKSGASLEIVQRAMEIRHMQNMKRL